MTAKPSDRSNLAKAAAAHLPLSPHGATTLALHVIGAKPGATVELVPGKTFVPVSPSSVETIALAELVPAGDGTFRMVARVCPRCFTLTPTNLKRLGIAISVRGMRRLIDAGFVKGEAITPGVRQFDYFDYRRHEAAVASDPEFWVRKQTGQSFTNRDRYRQAL
jgi:hypothetical protein